MNLPLRLAPPERENPDEQDPATLTIKRDPTRSMAQDTSKALVISKPDEGDHRCFGVLRKAPPFREGVAKILKALPDEMAQLDRRPPLKVPRHGQQRFGYRMLGLGEYVKQPPAPYIDGCRCHAQSSSVFDDWRRSAV